MNPSKDRIPANDAPALVARQPVYDNAMTVVAYKLLYRATPSILGEDAPDTLQTSLRVIANAALEIGLERLAGGLPVHIRLPREMIVSGLTVPIHPKRLVIEVPAEHLVDNAVLQGLAALRKLGHHIALDNYLPQGCDAALLEIAEMVKINVSQAHADELPRMVADLKHRNLKLIADDVETLEQFERCIGLGFAGFQGNFLQHPQTFRAQRVPTSRLGSLRLVTTLQNEDFSVDEVERLVSQDVAISFRVLRCINSSYYNLPRKVDSIRQAIVILGLDNLRQLCTLVALQGFDDRPPSLFVNAMTRARMCEQLGRLRGAKDVGPYFITGLFSMLNVLVGMPMQDILKELPLARAVTQALLEGKGDLGEALQCARAYERAAWKTAAFEGISPQLIRAAYVDAVFWAEEVRTQFAA
jgi:EAL and modified HD-GYP domain-containing signal transduction protein